MVITSLEPNPYESTEDNKARTTFKRRGSKAVLKTIQEAKPFCIQPSESYRTLTLLIIFKQSKEFVATAAVPAGSQYANKGCLDFTVLSLILHWKFDQPSYHLILLSAKHLTEKHSCPDLFPMSHHVARGNIILAPLLAGNGTEQGTMEGSK